MTVTRWWWIRHAPVDSGGRIYGATDLPADCSDIRLFRPLAARLPEPAVWITSSLQRTHQTADAILAERDAALPRPEIRRDAALIEQSFGDWHGLTYAELDALRGKERQSFWLTMAEEVPPNGESFAQLVERVSAAILRLTDSHAGQDIVAVAHGGTIRAALALALGLSPARALAFSIDNCSLTRIDHFETPQAPDGRAWRVGSVNDGPL